MHAKRERKIFNWRWLKKKPHAYREQERGREGESDHTDTQLTSVQLALQTTLPKLSQSMRMSCHLD